MTRPTNSPTYLIIALFSAFIILAWPFYLPSPPSEPSKYGFLLWLAWLSPHVLPSIYCIITAGIAASNYDGVMNTRDAGDAFLARAKLSPDFYERAGDTVFGVLALYAIVDTWYFLTFTCVLSKLPLFDPNDWVNVLVAVVVHLILATLAGLLSVVVSYFAFVQMVLGRSGLMGCIRGNKKSEEDLERNAGGDLQRCEGAELHLFTIQEEDEEDEEDEGVHGEKKAW